MSAATTDGDLSIEHGSGKDKGDENFPVGSWLIARRLRPHIHAYYAFARQADDIADAPDLPPLDRISRLDAMADALNGIRPDASPSAARLRDSLAVTRVDPRHATDLLVAFRDDATRLRYPNWDALMGYCSHSAMPVGRYVLDLHGEDPRKVYPPSDALCAALQVLNHLQDCAADLASLDRCYLPDDLLAANGASVDDLRRDRATPGLRRVLDALLDRVDALHATARALPGQVRDRRLRLECAVIVGLSQRLARRLRTGDPLAGRVKLTRGDAVASLIAAVRYL